RVRWWRLFGVFVALTMVAGACSSDRGEDPAARAEGDGAAEDGGDGGDGGDEGGEDGFGTLPSPCGEGEGGPATEQGVTEDQIVIGYGDDAGYPTSPGLSHETSDA